MNCFRMLARFGRLRQLGKTGFLFFAAKGMLWLFLPVLAHHLFA